MGNYKQPTHEDIADRGELSRLPDKLVLALLQYPTGDKLQDVQNEVLYRIFAYILDMRVPKSTLEQLRKDIA